MNTKKTELSQSDKFKEAARELESDESEEALDKALAKMRIGKRDQVVESGGRGKQGPSRSGH